MRRYWKTVLKKPKTKKAAELLEKMNRQEWTELTGEVFEKIFKHSAVKRTKLAGLKRNIGFLKENDQQAKA